MKSGNEKWFLVLDKIEQKVRTCLYNATYDTYHVFDRVPKENPLAYECSGLPEVYHLNTSRCLLHGLDEFSERFETYDL